MKPFVFAAQYLVAKRVPTAFHVFVKTLDEAKLFVFLQILFQSVALRGLGGRH